VGDYPLAIGEALNCSLIDCFSHYSYNVPKLMQDALFNIDSIKDLVLKVASVGTLVVAVLAVLSKSLLALPWPEVKKKLYGGISDDRPRDLLGKRLGELGRLLIEQKRAALFFTWISRLLTFIQFIVGALLTTSFVQDTLSKQNIGVFGLIVLISSLLRQYYRPEVQASGARERVFLINNLTRTIEDEVELGKKELPDLIEMLSDGIRRIELSQLSEFQTQMSRLDKPQSAKPVVKTPRRPRGSSDS
jgi:hypothetical protein